MTEIVCNGKCEECDPSYWYYINKNGKFVMGNGIKLHNCNKIKLETGDTNNDINPNIKG